MGSPERLGTETLLTPNTESAEACPILNALPSDSWMNIQDANIDFVKIYRIV